MDVGKRIRQLRDKKGMEQLELANKINISQSKMNKIETGFQKRIEPELLIDIANALNTNVDDLLGSSSKKDNDEEEFQSFINDPELGLWFKELKDSPEEQVEELRKIWEIIKGRETGNSKDKKS